MNFETAQGHSAGSGPAELARRPEALILQSVTRHPENPNRGFAFLPPGNASRRAIRVWQGKARTGTRAAGD
jgi:hypothetical protein